MDPKAEPSAEGSVPIPVTSEAALARRRRKLLRAFDRFTRLARRSLEARFGGSAGVIADEARREFEGLADSIPYKGRDRDLMVQNIVGPTFRLAFVLVLRRRGYSREEIGAWIGESEDRPVRWLPAGWVVAAWRIARPLLRPLIRHAYRRAAEASQRRNDPDEFVFAAVDDPESDLAFDILRCAVCQTFARHDALDIVPYLCALDDKFSDALGAGLRRSGTLGLGADRCDFRFAIGAKPLRLREQYDLPTAKLPGNTTRTV
jgi:hypothetical protein